MEHSLKPKNKKGLVLDTRQYEALHIMMKAAQSYYHKQSSPDIVKLTDNILRIGVIDGMCANLESGISYLKHQPSHRIEISFTLAEAAVFITGIIPPLNNRYYEAVKDTIREYAYSIIKLHYAECKE